MRLLRHTSLRLGAPLLLGLATVAVVAPWLPLADPGAARLADQLLEPGAGRWFGTDTLGRDLLSRTLFGIRSSLFIGLLGGLVSLGIGVLVGALAGFSGPRLDNLLMRMVDLIYGIPFICLVIFLLAVLRDHEPVLRSHGITRETVLYCVVGATTWLTMARMVRTEIIRLRGQPFAEAARALGLSKSRILCRHLLPNTFGIIMVTLTMTIPSILLYEAFLSFLGLGIEPPGVSLGLLAAEGVDALSPIHLSWWMVLFPGGALALLLLSFSLVGDGLRDVLDPHR